MNVEVKILLGFLFIACLLGYLIYLNKKEGENGRTS